MKILILRGGALGDFIVTLPMLVAIRHRWPSARIELVGNASAAELARARGWLDTVYSQHESRWSALYTANPLPKPFFDWLGECDAILSFWPDRDGTLAGHFPCTAKQRFIAAAALPTRAPAAKHYASAMEPLGVDAANVPDWIPLVNAAARHVLSNSGPIAIHPGSGSPRKNWPVERWYQFIAKLDGTVLLIVGEAERKYWDTAAIQASPLASRLASGSLRIALNVPLEQLVAEISACRIFVGHDSGVSHLAAATWIPCVLLFGPTDPAMWAPPAPHVRVIRHGDDLASITVDEVFAAMRRRA